MAKRPRCGVVDLGSNSVRLVIYENQSRNAATWQNEKSICAIGRDMVTSGRLHAEGCAAALEALFRALAEEKGVGAGKLIHPVRLAVSGVSFGPGLFEMLEALGRDTVVRRLRRARAHVASRG